MPKMKDLTGLKFGRWTVINFSHKDEKRIAYWLCKCDCGTERIVSGNNLTTGKSVSCGCYRSELNSKNHQLGKDKSRTRIYNCWSNMKRRCYNPNNCMYERYGARGVKVCDEWRTNFQNFYQWSLSNGYADNLTIDRIDTNGNYEPSNCRWITNLEQANNKSTNCFIEYKGQTLTLAQWSRELNIGYDFLKHRIRNGFTLEEIIATGS